MPPPRTLVTPQPVFHPHLPRVKIEVLPPEVLRKGLDAFKRVGEEVREVLERRPASMVVVEVAAMRLSN